MIFFNLYSEINAYVSMQYYHFMYFPCNNTILCIYVEITVKEVFSDSNNIIL